ncbi:hypothetical protein COHA_009136 [Chlorella ohadii]|uniref:F-box domain-containing protein n=1 Tax=Chlorella ohadii TaxID=2649997 RepID=A0AAD5DK73_9CHLO|nr:hypothetical protein COHA_009136 [Chlorella ohadii]
MEAQQAASQLCDLDDHLLLQCFSHLTPLPDLFNVAAACRRFRDLALDRRTWLYVTHDAPTAPAAGLASPQQRRTPRHERPHQPPPARAPSSASLGGLARSASAVEVDDSPHWYRQQFGTLAEAVAASRPGDTILLEAGPEPHLIAAPVVVCHPVHILGGGAEAGDCVLAGAKGIEALIEFRSSGRLANLTLRATASACVAHTKGRLTVQEEAPAAKRLRVWRSAAEAAAGPGVLSVVETRIRARGAAVDLRGSGRLSSVRAIYSTGHALVWLEVDSANSQPRSSGSSSDAAEAAAAAAGELPAAAPPGTPAPSWLSKPFDPAAFQARVAAVMGCPQPAGPEQEAAGAPAEQGLGAMERKAEECLSDAAAQWSAPANPPPHAGGFDAPPHSSVVVPRPLPTSDHPLQWRLCGSWQPPPCWRSSHEELRNRCCSLLDTFTANGCLCPPGSDCKSTDLGSSAAGMQLSVQLAPIMEMCAPTPASTAIESATPLGEEAEEPLAVEEPQPYDEDDAMADMAALAAAAQDPRTARAEEPSFKTLPPEDVAPLMDTPTDDYDNWLTDADTAFMLVDPTSASSYAARAGAEAVLSQAGDAVAADVAVLRGEAVGVANAAEGRLQRLLSSLDMSLEELEQKLAAVGTATSDPEAESTWADPEEVASAAARTQPCYNEPQQTLQQCMPHTITRPVTAAHGRCGRASVAVVIWWL